MANSGSDEEGALGIDIGGDLGDDDAYPETVVSREINKLHVDGDIYADIETSNTLSYGSISADGDIIGDITISNTGSSSSDISAGGALSGNIEIAGLWAGNISAGTNITGNINITRQTYSIGSIKANNGAGNITGTVNIPYFSGNICAANIDTISVPPNINIGNECGWTVCEADVIGHDNDADGLHLCSDNCPDHYNPDQRDYDGDGTGDVCEIVIYVNDDASGLNDGSSWANAYTSLQSALSAATAGDDIWLAAGTYKPSVRLDSGDGRSVSFRIPSGASIYGGLLGNEPKTFNMNRRDFESHETILSGDIDDDDILDDDNCYCVVTFADTSGSTLLDGFIVAYGYANGATYYDGAGLNTYVPGTVATSGKVQNCTFRNNQSKHGAIFLRSSVNNFTVERCAFIDNIATEYGGAVYNTYVGTGVKYTDCRFYGNSSSGDAGAVWNEFSNCDFVNCAFVGNTAHTDGGAVFDYQSDTTWTNCTFANNKANMSAGTSKGGGLCNSWDSATVTNCIFWGNTPDQLADYHTVPPIVTYSCIENSYQGTNNINSDPLFIRNPDSGANGWDGVDDDYGDLHLKDTSPCRNAGDNTVVAGIDSDLVGWPRVLDTTVDMGAYEFGGALPVYDFDSDGDIDQEDFARLQRLFFVTGANLPDPSDGVWYSADYNLDGKTNEADVAFFNLCATGPGLEWDTDGDGTPDYLDPDTDGDGILNDGDGSGFPDDAFCIGGDTTGCDDNAVLAINADQADADSDGVGDVIDNCSGVSNAGQADTDEDGTGDACDNCINVANDQTDTDSDGAGDACDVCAGYDDTIDADSDGVPDGCDQCAGYDDADDADGDEVPDDCDNCPSIPNPSQWDTDNDGEGDDCEDDIDGDGILDDGDGNGINWDNPCAIDPNDPETPTDCDDNCPIDANANQYDSDVPPDGVGDACEWMAMSMVMPLCTATGRFETHDGGQSSVTLPSSGGTVVVDLVIDHTCAINGFDLEMVVSEANVIGIDSADWTARDNVMVSYDVPGYSLDSDYDLTTWGWYVGQADGSYTLGTGPAELLADPTLTVVPLTNNLDAISGTIDTHYIGSWARVDEMLWAVANGPIAAGETVAATLTLNVAAVPGSYKVAFANATMMSGSETLELNQRTVFTITVQD